MYIKKICENHEYSNIEMPSPNNNIIKYNQGEKSLELPFIIYAHLECLLKKIDTCYNNPDLSSTTKINQHIHQDIQFILIVHLINPIIYYL